MTQTPVSFTSLVRVTDSDGDASYDLLIGVPAGMDPQAAANLIDTTIDQVKAADPEEYNDGQLAEALAPHGLVLLTPVDAAALW